MTVELLAWAAPQVHADVAGIDPDQAAEPVSWAAAGLAPAWLDVARELTERWVHQQQLREALGRPGGDGPELVGPVLATFARSLPRSLGGVASPVGGAVRRTVTGRGGASWDVVREAGGWTLYDRVAATEPRVVVATDAGTAWRAYVRGLGPGEVSGRVRGRARSSAGGCGPRRRGRHRVTSPAALPPDRTGRQRERHLPSS